MRGRRALPRLMRTVVVLFAVAAVALAAYHKKRDPGSTRSHAGALRLVYAYSSNQEDLLLPLIREFNEGRYQVAGRRIEIVGESVSSGEAETKIAARAFRPVIWSPASSLWGQLLD